jgi:hypothetical protein
MNSEGVQGVQGVRGVQGEEPGARSQEDLGQASAGQKRPYVVNQKISVSGYSTAISI